MTFSTRALAVLAMAKMVFAAGNSTTTSPAAASSAAAAKAAASVAAAAAKALSLKAAMFNQDFYDYLLIVCASLVAALFLWRVTIESVKHIRTLTCLANDTQRYYSMPTEKWASFKRHVLYAPIFRKRHSREIQLSSAINVGTLPTRFQFFILMGYFATNIAFCVVSIDWKQPLTTYAREMRNRTGVLAVVNMIPLFIMAGRTNLLINWLNLSFDSFNLLHRWFGRIVVIESVAHGIAWAVGTVASKGWHGVATSIHTDQQVIYGFVAVIVMIAITIQASSVVRHAFYETFKYLHIAFAIVVIIGLWYHLRLAKLPQITLLYGVITIWVFERVSRIAKVFYRNRFGSRALIEALPGNACRVTIDMPNPWKFKAGQHAYLYMPSVGLMTSHPFSVAWSEEKEDLSGESLVMTRQDILAMRKTSMSFIIRQRTGFTSKLFRKADASPDKKFSTNVFAEGPYGGLHGMHSYGTVMLFAGGVGITNQVPHVRDLVAGFSSGTVATRRILLVWIVQEPEHLEWIRPWLTSILAMDRRKDVLRVMLFVSRPKSVKDIQSPSSIVQMFPGRPNIESLLNSEIENQVGAMGVSVCGSGALSDDVRAAVRSKQGVSNVDFVEESFSW